MTSSDELVHVHLQAWNECEAAGENYLNTYAAMRSDDEDDEVEEPEGELFNAEEHPVVHAHQTTLKVRISLRSAALHVTMVILKQCSSERSDEH